MASDASPDSPIQPKPRPDLEKLALLAGIASGLLSALTAIAKALAWLWGAL
jgi:hypothetical protein